MWDIISKKTTAQKALPFGTVLTLAATGSEMNPDSVITNWETNEKYVWGSSVTHPAFSILDPEHTYSVPENQTVYGMVDMMSHVFEQYFHNVKNTPLQDRMCFAVLQTVIETAPKLLEDLQNYEHRETILYAGTIALNGTLQWVTLATGRPIRLSMLYRLSMTFRMQAGLLSSSQTGCATRSIIM
ncbi:hypothetical protein BsIDN1_55440 [Bacillus safensis]|uniref:Uncharacterized protein n=1 Tax=Bacillus safensis TaxID=561879 RepID=A0A5S9MJY6_BACIA|nr:hypothetical protein BsIDN1_55440 [Bacillus safensis]